MSTWDDVYARMQGGQGAGPGHALSPEYQAWLNAHRAQKQALGIKADGSGGGRAALAAAGTPYTPFVGERFATPQARSTIGTAAKGGVPMLGQDPPLDVLPPGTSYVTRPGASTATPGDPNSFTSGASRPPNMMRPGASSEPMGAPGSFMNGAAYAPPATPPSGAGVTPGGGGGGSAIPRTPTIGGTATGQMPIGYGFDVSEFYDPSYEWRLNQGLDAMEQSAAARGSLMSGETLRALNDYAGGSASQEFSNAFNRGTNVRDFTWGVDRDDRNFDYTAQTGDRAFELDRLSRLMQAGLSAAGGQAGGNNALAGILAGLLGNRGVIEGQGALGGNNAINGGISQIINFLIQNGMLNSLTRT